MRSILEYFLQSVLLLLIDEQKFASKVGVEPIPLYLIAQLFNGGVDEQQLFSIARKDR
jgi:hypothetical protein